MAGAFRVGDSDSDGDVQTQGSPNVIVNGRGLARSGDVDSDGDIQVTGSDSVITNSKLSSREGDSDSDGDVNGIGSDNVIIGGGTEMGDEDISPYEVPDPGDNNPGDNDPDPGGGGQIWDGDGYN